MSVINSMLRDLDRRHAPLPVKTHAQPAFVQKHRAWPRSAFALCALIIVVIWSWGHNAQKNIALPAEPIRSQKNEVMPANDRSNLKPITTTNSQIEIKVAETEVPKAKQPNADVAQIESKKEIVTNGADGPPLPSRGGGSRSETEGSSPENMTPSSPRDTPPTAQGKPVASTSAPVIKQERANPNAINDERYQLARAALAQNQPQRAYELLRDNPPPLVAALDYHVVLAAVEQQLGHYADASLRYQQLLMLDQNQASWWLGFALSLEGEHRNNDALAAYRHATILNSLPDAARQYVTARIAALSTTNGQTVAAEH